MTDMAYITTLQKAIARATAAGTKADRVQAAEAVLQTIRDKTPAAPAEGKDARDNLPLDDWRAAMAKAIMELQ